MTSKSKIVLATLVGAAIGGAAIHGLHAQTKPKAYTVTELETLDAKAAADVASAHSRRCKRAQAAVISALAVERLRPWKDRRRPSVSLSQNGITLTKHRHSSSQRNGPIWDRSVTRRSRPYAGMRWKNETDIYRVDHQLQSGGRLSWRPHMTRQPKEVSL